MFKEVHGTDESVSEMGCVTYMPGVYKIPMVRMSEKTDEFANVRVQIFGL